MIGPPLRLPDVGFKPLHCCILILEAGIRRRELIRVIAGAVAALPLAARAQQAGPASLIGVLMEQRRAVRLHNPGSQHSEMNLRSWDGRMEAICGSNFAGAPAMRRC
jgi:hypothetical protein